MYMAGNIGREFRKSKVFYIGMVKVVNIINPTSMRSIDLGAELAS